MLLYNKDMFFFLIGFLIGVYTVQEYPENIPNVRVLVQRASNILREAIRGENDEEEKGD